ncbi:alpha-1,2-fucosyltransferase [Microbacterium aurum]|uniref:alpha-1,2-fucosyltransferase n=1 Tax=Microbacterium aurum TaxID=36805 RepID=UPI0018DDBDC8|nr:alpha-1,2-fucosyltransferase [Microbacterium aurum]MBM7828991.1 hypothetical protein [Microbacterium aurum]
MTSARDISDGICAYLQGGFGNQLFILAAAWQQADRLSCPLYIDASRFLAGDPLERAKETPRDYELSGLEGRGILIEADSPWYRNSPRRPAVIRRTGRSSRHLKVWRQPTFGYHEEVNLVTPGTTLLGYFQSPRYFDRVAEQLATTLEEAVLSDEESRWLRPFEHEAAITAHVRRGDYLNPQTALHHGIASGAYFTRAIATLRALAAPTSHIRVFSDSPEMARRELSHLGDVSFVDEPSNLRGLATIRAMSRGTAFAMSNSSFSWWAAWLLTRRKPTAPVVAPRPWRADGQSGHDQLLPEWLTLDAR